MVDKYLEYKEEILHMQEKWHQLGENEQVAYKDKIDRFLFRKSKEDLAIIAEILTECVNEDISTLEDVSRIIEQNNSLSRNLNIA